MRRENLKVHVPLKTGEMDRKSRHGAVFCLICIEVYWNVAKKLSFYIRRPVSGFAVPESISSKLDLAQSAIAVIILCLNELRSNRKKPQMANSLLKKDDRPFFQALQSEIDRVFDDFRQLTSLNTDDVFRGSNGRLVPKLDVSETTEEVEITTELPGVKLDDIDISVTDNFLTIKGEKSAEACKGEKDYHLSERHYGSFLRTIPLGFQVDSNQVAADFADGVLTINVKKPPEVAAKSQKIEISSAA